MTLPRSPRALARAALAAAAPLLAACSSPPPPEAPTPRLTARDTAFLDPRSYFNRYSKFSDKQATDKALALWNTINLVNLQENILPTRPRATLILKKGSDHVIETVSLRRL